MLDERSNVDKGIETDNITGSSKKSYQVYCLGNHQNLGLSNAFCTPESHQISIENQHPA